MGFGIYINKAITVAGWLDGILMALPFARRKEPCLSEKVPMIRRGGGHTCLIQESEKDQGRITGTRHPSHGHTRLRTHGHAPLLTNHGHTRPITRHTPSLFTGTRQNLPHGPNPRMRNPARATMN